MDKIVFKGLKSSRSGFWRKWGFPISEKMKLSKCTLFLLLITPEKIKDIKQLIIRLKGGQRSRLARDLRSRGTIQ